MSRAGATLFKIREVWRTALATDYPEVGVFLGPLVSGDPDDAVFVGYDGDPFGDMEAVVHLQNWGALGMHKRDEEFDVRCCILNRTGATDPEGIDAAFTRLYAMFSAMTNSLFAEPSLGFPAPYWAEIRGLTAFMGLTASEEGGGGVEPRIMFNVHVTTRI